MDRNALMLAVGSTHIDVREEACSLIDYAAIPIAFEVTRVLDVTERPGTDEFLLSERALEIPFVKDYDAIPGEDPLHWAERFDIRDWRFFGAWSDGRRVGGAAVFHATPTLESLESRADVAVLWDIRVAPEVRGRGVGAALVHAVERWASGQQCRELEVETQNINVPACRFYQQLGFVLKTVNRSAYAAFPDEVQLLWHKPVARSDSEQGFQNRCGPPAGRDRARGRTS